MNDTPTNKADCVRRTQEGIVEDQSINGEPKNPPDGLKGDEAAEELFGRLLAIAQKAKEPYLMDIANAKKKSGGVKMSDLADMVHMQRVHLYDEMCRVLTDYENPEDVEDYKDIDWTDELYHMLVKIQNNWDVLTGSY